MERFSTQEGHKSPTFPVMCTYVTKRYSFRNFRLYILIEKCLFSVTSIDENSSLCEVVSCRQAEARRSILVQVQSSHSYKELYAYCNNIGKIKSMFHYQCGVEPLVCSCQFVFFYNNFKVVDIFSIIF